MVVSNIWQLLAHQPGIDYIGAYEDILLRHDANKTVVCLLKLRPSTTEKVNKLFRLILAAARPQTLALAASQYHAIVVPVICHHIRYRLSIRFSATKIHINNESTKLFIFFFLKSLLIRKKHVPLHPY